MNRKGFSVQIDEHSNENWHLPLWMKSKVYLKQTFWNSFIIRFNILFFCVALKKHWILKYFQTKWPKIVILHFGVQFNKVICKWNCHLYSIKIPLKQKCFGVTTEKQVFFTAFSVIIFFFFFYFFEMRYFTDYSFLFVLQSCITLIS